MAKATQVSETTLVLNNAEIATLLAVLGERNIDSYKVTKERDYGHRLAGYSVEETQEAGDGIFDVLDYLVNGA